MAAAIGRVSGRMMCQKIRAAFAPSTRAASNSSSGMPLTKLRVSSTAERDLERRQRQDDGPVGVVQAELDRGREQRGEQHHLGQRERRQHHPEVDLPAADVQLGEAERGQHGQAVDDDDHAGRDDGAVAEELGDDPGAQHRPVVAPALAGQRFLHHRDEREQVGQHHDGQDDLQDYLRAQPPGLEHGESVPPRSADAEGRCAPPSARISSMIDSAAPYPTSACGMLIR